MNARGMLLVALLATTQLVAQEQNNDAGTPKAKAVGDKQKDPFKITVGYDADNGGFGASVKGSRVYFNDNPDKQPFDAWRIPYVEIVTDAHWSPQPDALNNAAISLRPGVMRFISQENVAAPGTFSDSLNHVEIYADLRERYGQFKGQTAGQVVNVSQSIVGVGVDYAFLGKLVKCILSVDAGQPCAQDPKTLLDDIDTSGDDPFKAPKASGRSLSLDKTPVLSIRYYHVMDTSDTAQQVPKGIDSDKIVAQFKGDLTIPRLGGARARFRFLFDLSVDYPTKGSNRALHDFYDVAIAMQLGKMPAKPVVRYTNGEQGGFKFDRQFLIGFLWDVAKDRL